MATATTEDQTTGIKTHSNPDLEYCFRDFFSVYAGADMVVIELGNVHPADKDQARIANIIVLSPASALQLRNTLHKVLTARQQNLRKSAAPKGQKGETH
jgi:hypothetical protein